MIVRRVAVALMLALGAGAGLVATQTPAPPQRQPVFRGGANFVLVDAYPQRDEKIVEGLTASDFEILEDGKPQKVDSVEFVRVEPGVPDGERRDPNNQREMLQQAADPHNRVFVVFLDALHTAVDGSHAIRRPLVNTLNRIVAPRDLFGVTTNNLRPRDLVLGRRLESVEEQLARYWPWGLRQSVASDLSDPAEAYLRGCFEFKPVQGLPPWMVDDGAVRRFLYQVLIERRREDRTLTAIADLVDYLGTLREARTTLLLVSDGWLLFKEDRVLMQEGTVIGASVPGVYVGPGGRPTLSPGIGEHADYAQCLVELNRLASLDNERRLREIINAANRHNVSFYPIAASGLAAFDGTIAERVILNPRAPEGETPLKRDFDRTRDRVSHLRTIAENTDGIAVVSTNDIAGGLKRIVDDVSAYYLLGYYSTNTKFDGRLRRIEVNVKQPNVRVRARRGYMAPTEAMLAPPTGGVSTPAPTPSTVPVDEALGVLARLRPGADLHAHAVARDSRLDVAVELSSRAIELGAWAKGGSVTVRVSAAGMPDASVTATIEPGFRGVLVPVPIAKTSGPWQVAIRLRQDGEIIDERLDVQPAPEGLLSPPLIYRGPPSPRAPLRPVADFQFRRTERAHLEWAIAKPLDNRTARLLDRRGAPLPVPVALTERAVDGITMLAADIQLAPLTDGDYVVEVNATSGPASDRSLVPLRVVR